MSKNTTQLFKPITLRKTMRDDGVIKDINLAFEQTWDKIRKLSAASSTTNVYNQKGTNNLIDDLTDNYVPKYDKRQNKFKDSPIYVSGTSIGVNTITPARTVEIVTTDSESSAVSYPLRVTHKSGGTVGCGVGIEFVTNMSEQ